MRFIPLTTRWEWNILQPMVQYCHAEELRMTLRDKLVSVAQCHIFEADSVFENSRFLVPQLCHMVGGLLMSAYFPACSIGHSDDVYPLLREGNRTTLEVITG